MTDIKGFKIRQLTWKIQNNESARVKAELDIEEYTMNQQLKIQGYDEQITKDKEQLKNLQKDGNK